YMIIIISKEEYKRRKRIRNKKNYQDKLKTKGQLSKKEEINKRREKIIDLLGKGLKRKDICSTLSISIKTYKRDIQFIKEQGLI
ncbi:DNA-binding response regulator, partial [Clostridium perfringens]|nr:DNA-binding response regulator [Clostridium perfringens]